METKRWEELKTDYDLLCLYKDQYNEDIYKTGIYKIFFIERPEYFYIGMASSIRKFNCNKGFYSRWKRHLSDFKNNNHKNSFLQNQYNSFGFKSLRFEILELCNSEECKNREDYWFAELKPPTNFQGNKEYKKKECLPEGISNRKIRSGFTHSEDTKAKMSISASNRVYERKTIDQETLSFVLKELDLGKCLTKISKEIHRGYSDVLKDLEILLTKENFNKVLEKSKENKNNILLKTNTNKPITNYLEKYKEIVPIIEDLYRKGTLIKNIRPFVNINEDLIGKLIKLIFSAEELKSIKSNNAKRK